MNLLELAKISNGKLIGKSIDVNSFSIDTRTLKPSDTYIALLGENFDGHDFISDALDKGASAVITSKPIAIKIPQIVVSDTHKFLNMVAIHNRKNFKGKLIGITGTNGKTSTKQIISNLLENRGLCHNTIGNKNNQIGVPFTLLSLQPKHDFSVIEIGTSEPGEIGILSNLVKPDIAAITNVSLGHLDGLKDTKSIAEEKGNIIKFSTDCGVAILPRDSDFYYFWSENTNASEQISFGFHKESDFRVSDIKIDINNNSTDFKLCFDKRSENLSIKGISQYNALNAALSVATGLYCGLTIKDIRYSLLETRLPERRLNISLARNGSTLIDDSYNSNPASMKNALDSLEKANGQKICVLGSMKEMGPKSKEIHKDIYNYASKRADMIFCMGEEWAGCDTDENLIIYKDHKDLYDHLITLIDENTIILVKGSRSTRMDLIADKLKNNATTTI